MTVLVTVAQFLLQSSVILCVHIGIVVHIAMHYALIFLHLCILLHWDFGDRNN